MNRYRIATLAVVLALLAGGCAGRAADAFDDVAQPRAGAITVSDDELPVDAQRLIDAVGDSDASPTQTETLQDMVRLVCTSSLTVDDVVDSIIATVPDDQQEHYAKFLGVAMEACRT